jgi:PTS system ascorbate-specific IIA component
MVGILLIAHAPLASAMAACARHVYSCAPEVASREVRVIDVEPGADVQTEVERARGEVAALDHGQGVLVMTDAFGATPGNVASQLASPGRVAVVAGINLPMLLRTLCYRGDHLAEMIDKALAGGTQGVLQVVGTPVQNQGFKPQGNDLARLHHQQ